jgi:AcrR family transcriptional regulator
MPKRVDKEAKKNEILHVAMRIFAKNGVVKTKMADIAQAAAIGKGTIYEYFRSKEDIFAAAFQHVFNNMDKSLKEAFKSSDDPVNKLKSIVDVSLREFLQNTDEFAAIMMDFWAEGIRNKDDKILNLIDLKQIYVQYRDLIATILDDGIKQNIFRKVNTHEMASALIAALDGLMLQWILDKDIFDTNKVAEAVWDGFFHGIKK